MEVRSNFAISLDGQISTRDRAPVRFTSKEDRAGMARLRAWADAVLVGAATLRADDPTLGIFGARLRAARQRERGASEPLRCVVTRSGALRASLAIFRRASRRPLVFAPRRVAAALRRRLAHRAEVIASSGQSVSPRAILDVLAKRHGVRRLLLEGGGALHFDFLRAGLVDEIHVTLCPLLLGGEDAAPRLVDGRGFAPGAAPRLELLEVRRGKTEIFLRYRVAGRARFSRRPAPPWRRETGPSAAARRKRRRA